MPTEGGNGVAAEIASQGRSHFLHGDYARAVEFYHQALIAGEVGDWRAVVGLFAEIGLVYVTIGRLDRARTYSDDALSLLGEHEDPALRARVALTEGAHAHAAGDGRAAERFLACARDRAAGSPTEVTCEATILMAEASMEAGGLDVAEPLVAEARSNADRLASDDLGQRARLAQAVLAGLRGRHQEAAEALTQVRQFADDHDRPELAWRALHALGNVHRAQGDVREAAHLYLQAMDILKRTWERLPTEYREAFLQDRHRRALQADIQGLKGAAQSVSQAIGR